MNFPTDIFDSYWNVLGKEYWMAPYGSPWANIFKKLSQLKNVRASVLQTEENQPPDHSRWLSLFAFELILYRVPLSIQMYLIWNRPLKKFFSTGPQFIDKAYPNICLCHIFEVRCWPLDYHIGRLGGFRGWRLLFWDGGGILVRV